MYHFCFKETLLTQINKYIFKTAFGHLQNGKNAIKRNLMFSSAKLREITDRKEMLRSLPLKDEGTAGEYSGFMDSISTNRDVLDGDKLFAGVRFDNLPIINIRVSPNNTIINLTDAKGVPKMIRSCGIEGFKNAKKGTNIAAQATALSMGNKSIERGVKTVKVRVRGLGPGRMSAIKGLQMAGLDIISITDNTRVSWNPPKPRKQKKL